MDNMNKLDLEEVRKYVEENISDFHIKRVEKLDQLKLKTILRRKNPYLFKAKKHSYSPRVNSSHS